MQKRCRSIFSTTTKSNLKCMAGNISSIFDIPPIAHEVIRSLGQPLYLCTRSLMEPHFGYDFGQMRVLTNPRVLRVTCYEYRGFIRLLEDQSNKELGM